MLTSTQLLNGLLAPMILCFPMLLSSDGIVMRARKDGRVSALVGWLPECLATLALLIEFGTEFWAAAGPR